MSDFHCPECKDTGVYQGLNTVEPCRACGGKAATSLFRKPMFPNKFITQELIDDAGVPINYLADSYPKIRPTESTLFIPPEIAQVMDCGKTVERFLRDELTKQMAESISGGQSISHELQEQATEEWPKPFDEIMPAELEGVTIGDEIKVSIQCEDFLRAFEIMDRFINRPLFGKPNQSFRLKSVGIYKPDENGKREIMGTILYKPISEADWWTVRDKQGNLINRQCLYGSDPCHDMLFIPMLEG